jgi:hypothetical protein
MTSTSQPVVISPQGASALRPPPVLARQQASVTVPRVYSKHPSPEATSDEDDNYVVVSDPVYETTKAILQRRPNVAVAVDECAAWLPQWSAKAGAYVGTPRPLVVFLQTSTAIAGVPSAHEYQGRSGVYTCPKTLRSAFAGDRDILWISSSSFLRQVKKAEYPVDLVAKKVVKIYTKLQRVQRVVRRVREALSVAAPVVAGLSAAL